MNQMNELNSFDLHKKLEVIQTEKNSLKKF